jgi:hypothetical protein
MGKLVSNSFKPPLPFSKSVAPNPEKSSLPKARAEAFPAASQEVEEGCGAWTGDRGGERAGPTGEMDRLPSCGGGERVLFVSGDWS